ncbi:DUF1302 domain-containing protein [Pseudomonas sp. CrR25]|nr:DUF1302 domain-containing protein [Pseudomonas sp. CrR25]
MSGSNKGNHCLLGSNFLVVFGLAWVGHVSAVEFSFFDDDVNGSVDTTVSYGTLWRVQGADTINEDINRNDANRNFDTGLVSEVYKVTSDLGVNYKNYGAFVRGTAFYDAQIMDRHNDYNNNNTPSQPSQNFPSDNHFTQETRDTAGHDAELLDAYVHGGWIVANLPVSARIGRQVFNWGEGLFYRGGVNTTNPVNALKFRLPGAELKEALIPLEAVNLNLDLTDALSLETFYQWNWKENAIDPVGTYFADTDIFGPGGDVAYTVPDLSTAGGVRLQRAATGYARFASTFPALPPGAQNAISATGLFSGGINTVYSDSRAIKVSSVGSDLNARDNGQFGIALRYLAQELNATEFGFYLVNYHATDPGIHTDLNGYGGVNIAQLAPMVGGATAAAGLATIDLLGNVHVRREYAEDIRMFGTSFSTTLGESSLFGELAYRPNVPIAISASTDLIGDIAAQAPAFADNSGTLGNGTALLAGERIGRSGSVSNTDRVEMFRLSLGTARVFGPALGFDSLVGVAEVASEHLRGSDLQYRAYDDSIREYTSRANLAYTSGGSRSDQITRDAYGFTLSVSGSWNDIFNGITLSPFVVYKDDFKGNSHLSGNFIEGRKAYTLGLRASYQNNLQAELQYTEFYGAGAENVQRDRDNIGLTLKYSF